MKRITAFPAIQQCFQWICITEDRARDKNKIIEINFTNGDFLRKCS